MLIKWFFKQLMRVWAWRTIVYLKREGIPLGYKASSYILEEKFINIEITDVPHDIRVFRMHGMSDYPLIIEHVQNIKTPKHMRFYFKEGDLLFEVDQRSAKSLNKIIRYYLTNYSKYMELSNGRTRPTLKTNCKLGFYKKWGEKLINTLSFWIPRRYREPFRGDLIEDCRELRVLGKSRLRIYVHVVWQFVIGIIILLPSALLYNSKNKAKLHKD